MEPVYSWGLLAWLAMSFLAILNAGMRERFFKERMSELRAHQLSTVTLIAMILAATKAFLVLLEPEATTGQLFVLGVVWMLLTLAFEFLMGHYAFGNSWRKLLADYDLARGRVWVLVPVAMLLAPWLIGSVL
ncbi:hypothetical protein KY327_03985 [Candidatus Woesearchaeota archaeon]|nr:hypothetical protein [Candidatus Woesearchaeota archaeon]